MVLIIGGAYQGKRRYAREVLAMEEGQIVDQAACQIREMLRAGKDPQKEIEALLPQWADKAVLLDDVSCGLVPMDAEERAFREAVGRCGAMLAARATRVIRVFCGIGVTLGHA